VKKPTSQLALNLLVEPRFGREDFLVSPSNETAWDVFERWPEWPGRMLMLLGPTGSGKSHLATIWAHRAGARIVSAASLPLADLTAVAAAGAVLVEDADRAPLAEAELFHLINLVQAGQGYLAITARAWPDAWGVQTKDLLSRLRLAPVIEIGEPDDSLIRAVLVKLFFDRQLVVDTSVVEYLAVRIERSLDAARNVVEVLDQEALAAGRPVTRPMAAEVLRRSGVEP
jgi:chromosomal replication initiation ATPase DnaA